MYRFYIKSQFVFVFELQYIIIIIIIIIIISKNTNVIALCISMYNNIMGPTSKTRRGKFELIKLLMVILNILKTSLFSFM